MILSYYLKRKKGCDYFMKRAKQTSESIELGILLALSGGFMDAYSYLARGQVFANAQTGNMLLFGVNLARGQFQHALHYLCPVLAFGLGIFLAEFVHFQKIQKVHWRQVTLLIEIIILFGVGYISFKQNLLANSLTSFACGLQVQAFRKIHGKGYATTMCIGNLRTGTHEMCNYLCTKKVQHLQSGLLYYSIILTFIIGAILGNFCIQIFSAKAIWISVSLLILAFILMFIDREKDEAFQ